MNDSENIICIAVLLTCYNRKDKTLACLKKVYDQLIPEGVKLEITLVDDGSTDGTGDAVSDKYPDILIINGSGNLYWNQGMRLAWTEASKRRKYDYYLLLNDDTELYSDTIEKLVKTEQRLRVECNKSSIVVGSISNAVDGQLIYGGVTRQKGYLGLKFLLVEPTDKPQACDTFNANCVLISREIMENVGILSDQYTHAMGDTDYGLRAAEKGHGCFIVSGYVGKCEMNVAENTWLDSGLTLKQRKERLYSPLGRPPDEWIYFVKRHAGAVWILSWMQLYLRLYFPGLWKVLRRLRGREDA